MPFLLKRSWLLTLAVLVGGAALARAQDFQTRSLTDPTSAPNNVPSPVTTQEFQPFGPVQPGDIEGMQLFAPADLSEYGDYPRPHVGPWFQYDRVYWSFGRPTEGFIGTPLVTEDNDTSFIRAALAWGNRFEFGYMLDDDTGWEVSILKTNNQISSIHLGQTDIGFFNPTSGTILGIAPGTAGLVPFSISAVPQQGEFVTNFTRLTGVELMKVYRFEPPTNGGGVWEFSAGARFLQIHDRFDFVMPAVPSPLTAFWDEGINNDLIGPQVALTWTEQRQRWTINTELRALMAANYQNADIAGSTMNTNPPTLPQTSFSGRQDTITFAPLGELRVDVEFQVTAAMALRVGYTGMITTGIGRASQRIDYTLPNLGIIDGAKNGHFATNGLNFGVEFNR